MQKLAAGYLRLINFFRVAAGVIIFVAFVLIVVDVFIRLIGWQPWLYSSVLVEYGLLWFTMLAAPYLARVKAHVFIDAITRMLPRAAQRIAAKFAYLLCICATLVFAYFAMQLLIESIESEAVDIRAVDMPLWTLLLPIPFCFVLVAFEFVRFLVGIDSMYGDRTVVRENV